MTINPYAEITDTDDIYIGTLCANLLTQLSEQRKSGSQHSQALLDALNVVAQTLNTMVITGEPHNAARETDVFLLAYLMGVSVGIVAERTKNDSLAKLYAEKRQIPNIVYKSMIQNIARMTWRTDTNKKIRTGEMVATIKKKIKGTILENIKTSTIRTYVKEVAPDYARKSGATPSSK